MKGSRLVALEGGALVILALANSMQGHLLAAAMLISLAILALVSAWALWPTNR